MSKVSKPSMPEWSPIVSSERSALIADTKAAVDHAARTREWVVIVCPDGKTLDMVHRALSGVVPPKSSGAGRTFILPNRGRVSVAEATTEVFIPEGTPFTIQFLGWANATKDAFTGMNRWRLRASHTISDRMTSQVA